MTTPSPQPAQIALQKARQALREKRPAEARQWALQAIRLDEGLEEAWLILAAFAPPDESVRYIKRALAINPGSVRARQAMHWAISRMRTQPLSQSGVTQPVPVNTAALAETARIQVRQEQAAPLNPAVPAAAPATPVPRWVVTPTTAAARRAVAKKQRSTAFMWLAVALVFIVCAGLLGMLMIPLTGIVAAGVNSAYRPVGMLEKPSLTPSYTPTVTETPAPTGTPTATSTQTEIPSATPEPSKTPKPTKAPTNTPPPTVIPTQTILLPAPITEEQPAYDQPEVPITGEDRWVDVNLSQQTAAAYEGNQVVRSFVVSTGTALHPTVTGEFRVYVMYRYADMAGPGYYLPDVPYVMYFYKGYGLHGTYWHNNFGTPMSHGCVNFSIDDAAWLFDFVSVGTLVNVHY